MRKNNITSHQGKIQMTNLIRYSYFVLPGLIVFAFYQFLFPYHLFLKEQIRLFVFSSDYYLSYLNRPASLSAFLGDFFTQFYYLKGGGPTLITIIFYIICWLSYRVLKTFNKQSKSVYIWALLPAIAESTLHHLITYSLTNSFALIFTLSIYLLAVKLLSYRLNLLIIAALFIFTYFAAGGLFIALALLITLYMINKRSVNYSLVIIFFAISILIPLISRSHYLIPITEAYLYPNLTTDFFAPIAILTMLTIALGFIKDSTLIKNTALALAFASLPILVAFNKPNFTREKVLALDCENYFGHSKKVLQQAEEYQINNQLASYIVNNVLSKYDALPNRLLEFYQPFSKSLFLEVGPESSWLEIFLSNEAYFNVGDMNLTQHSAQLGLIFSPYNRSSRMVKRLAETNMIIGENEAALKYLRLLNKTLFHHKWAAKRIEMIHNPDLLSNSIREKQLLLPQTDTLRKGGDNISGLRLLTQSHPDNYAALDYLLCYHLLNKDLKSFKEDFEKFFTFNRPMPKLYGEALLIILYQQQASPDEVSKYFLPSSLMNEFVAYTDAYSQSKGQMNQDVNKYKTTYWYYYHFAQKNKNEN